MAFTYGYYIKPYIFNTIVAIAIMGVLASFFMLWTKSQGFVKTCSDFESMQDAQNAFGKYSKRYAGLDGDNDGKACNSHNYKKT